MFDLDCTMAASRAGSPASTRGELIENPLDHVQSMYEQSLRLLPPAQQERIRNVLRTRMGSVGYDVWARDAESRVFRGMPLADLQRLYVDLASMNMRGVQSRARGVLESRMTHQQCMSWRAEAIPRAQRAPRNASRSPQAQLTPRNPTRQRPAIPPPSDAVLQEVLGEQVESLSRSLGYTVETDEGLFDTPAFRRATDPAEHILAAKKMRDTIRANLRTAAHVCAVCNMFQNPGEMHVSSPIPWSDIPHPELLLRNGPQTREHPRNGRTFAAIQGMEYCLQPDFVHNADGQIQIDICAICAESLERGEIPPSSLVRMDTGGIPPHLPPLTLLEATIVAPNRPLRLLYITRPHSRHARADPNGEHWDDPTCAIADMRSHVIAVKNTAAADITGLLGPLPLEQVPELISVCILAPGTTEEQARRFAENVTAIQLNGPGIVTWSRHLHELEQKQPNEEELAKYAVINGAVPEVLIRNAVCARSQEEAKELLASLAINTNTYAKQRDEAEFEASNTGEPERDNTGTFMRGIDEVDMQLPTEGYVNGTTHDRISQLMNIPATENARVLNARGVLGLALSNPKAIASDYSSEWWSGVHFTMFPYGDTPRPAKMSEDEYFRILLWRYPAAQFQQNIPFLMDRFDIKQRHLVNTKSRIALNGSARLGTDLTHISEADAQTLCRIVGTGTSREARQGLLREANATVRAFYKSINCTAGDVLGSPQSTARVQSSLDAGWLMFGPQTLFVTANMSDIHSSICIEACGHTFVFDGRGYPANLPGFDERWRLVTKNPLMCAQYAHVYLNSFLEHILGFPQGAIEQDPTKGVFGSILWYNFKVENNKRLALHWHGCVTQREFQPHRLLDILRSDRMRVLMYTLMEAIQCQVLPGDYLSCVVCTDTETGRCAEHVNDPRVLVTPPQAERDCVRTRLTPIPDTREQIGRVLPELVRATAELASVYQYHGHNVGCVKIKNRKASVPRTIGTDKNCRLVFRRALQTRYGLVFHGTHIPLLPRKDGYLVPFSVAAIIADPCNTAIYHCAEQGRSHTLNKRLQDEGKPPISPMNAASASAAAARYTTKYTSKDDFDTPAEKTVRKILAIPKDIGGGRTGPRVISKIINAITGHRSCPATRACLYLLEGSEYTCSHAEVTMNVGLYRDFLLSQGSHAAAMAATPASFAFTLNQDGTLRMASELHDYLLRHTTMEMISPYLTRALLKRETLKAGLVYFPFQSEHPQHQTHGLVPTEGLVIPRPYIPILTRPTDEDDPEVKREYAATVLAMFSHYRLAEVMEGGWLHETADRSLWDIFVHWSQTAPPREQLLLSNYETYGQGRADSRAYANQCRDAGVFDDGDAPDLRGSFDPDAEEDGYGSEHDESDTIDNAVLAQDINMDLDEFIPDHEELVLALGSREAPSETVRGDPDDIVSAWRNREREYVAAGSLPTPPLPESLAHYATGPGGAYVMRYEDLVNEAALSGEVHWVRCVLPPTIQQACALWSLDPEQSTMVHMLAEVLLADEPPADSTQHSVIIQGGPGVGKTTAIKTLVWLAFQHGCLDRIALCAYTWQAANEMSLPHKQAVSTCNLFCMGHNARPRRGKAAKDALIENLRTVRICVTDEFSFLDDAHFENMHKQANIGKQRETSPIFFGGIVLAATGDIDQLPPVKKKALHVHAYLEEQGLLHDRLHGRLLWTQIPNVFILTHSHRFQENSAIYRLSRLFIDHRLATIPNVRDLIETLNACYEMTYTEAITQGHPIRIITPRNLQREALTHECARLIATRENQQIVMWQHSEKPKRKQGQIVTLTLDEISYIRGLTADKTAGIPRVGMFFEGIEYLITDCDAPLLKRTKNNTCVGLKLMLDPREPHVQADAPTPALRTLRYPPIGIVVKPRKALEHIAIHPPPIPHGCLVISQCKRTYPPEGLTRSIQMERTGIPLYPAYAITDYCSQGQTYGDDRMHFTDWAVPETGSMKKESGYVTLTRYRSPDQMHALRPLVEENETIDKSRATARYTALLQTRNLDKEAEMRRLMQLAHDTKERYAAIRNIYSPDTMDE